MQVVTGFASLHRRLEHQGDYPLVPRPTRSGQVYGIASTKPLLSEAYTELTQL